MSRFMCCLGGGSSSNVVQDPEEPPQPPQPPQPPEPTVSSETSDEEGFVKFQWNEIVEGTENFDITHLIGQGKVGKLYRCNFPRIHKVGAAKVHDHGDDFSGLGEFVAEITTLREADHPNVIKLLGRHYGLQNTALVYQFMPNGSLDHHLFGFVKFQWNEIVEGTENFDITHLIGQGKVGKLYRCNFPRIHKVGAAKVHDHGDDFSGLGEFVAEITTLREADHPNVIKLLGRHYGLQNTALVYQFMPNGSLDHHLFANARQVQGLTQATRVLDWNTRMRIAVGVAEGLVYVHQGLSSIHRDVKATNIVLDDNFVPKLTGFATAAKIAYDEDGVEMQREVSKNGTEGYLAPETENFGLVSTKSDVYSYGVFLLELFTGRKAYDRDRPKAREKLTDWLMPLLSLITRLEQSPIVVDVALGKKYSAQGSNRIFETARMCLNAQPLERPAMGFVETLVREAAAYLVPEEKPQVKDRRCST
ncbi:PREDICTED: probable serine/threonine-protein kinase RLCKVII [Camelina sativa]|uniref:Probable serine/threonine-protein kinase RLCKVII n=1 Tax=Camelina sativa TaxID=90675 RepID=A0ABM0UTQ7_CAMSA|nr:PREDICTED: probable serine/threonine-protein kinase RLCKVII [Camelina sativa]